MTFDRYCHRSSIGSITYANGAAIAPTIGCERLFDRVCSIPLIPYSDRSPRARLRGTAREAFEHGCAYAPLAFKRLTAAHDRDVGRPSQKQRHHRGNRHSGRIRAVTFEGGLEVSRARQSKAEILVTGRRARGRPSPTLRRQPWCQCTNHRCRPNRR